LPSQKGGSFGIPTTRQKGNTMKIKFAITAFAIAALLGPIAVQAAEPDSAKTVVTDSVITTKIKAKLAEEKMSTLTHVKVETDSKGAVILSGNVKTPAEADKAVSIARGTEGVTSVANKIMIKKDDQPAAPMK
jgi:hyperosmotically inducible protein